MFRIKPVVVATALVAGLVLAGAAAVAQEGEQTKKEAFRVVGKVKSKSGNTFTMETRQGDVKVQYDSNTQWVNGSESDLKEGVLVGAAGAMTNETLHASKIGYPREGEKGHRRKPRLIRGEVTEVSGHNFTLKTRRGDVKVVWDGDTKFHNGTAEDVKVGAKLGVAAQPSGQSEPAQSPSGERELPKQPIHAQHIVFKADCERPAAEPGSTSTAA